MAVFSATTKDIPLRSPLKHNIFSHGKRKLSTTPKEDASNASYESSLAAIVERCADSLPSMHTNGVNSASLEEGLCSSSTLSTPAGAVREAFLQQLQDCNDASISCHVIDLLSILFIHMESSRGFLAKITSDALHSVYTMCVGKANLPYTFFKLNSILSESAATNEQDETERTLMVKDSFSLLIQTSNALLKAKDSFTSAFAHHLLAHWSALILEGASQLHCLSEMVDTLGAFLLSNAFRRSRKQTSPSSKRNMALPGLNERTHTTLFELLLHMINTSFSLARPRRGNKKKRTSKEGPYRAIIWPMEVYTKLLSIFQSNHVFFPQRFILTAIKSSLLMIRLSDYQLRQCVQWRNSQPTQMGIGFDYAAVELLQPLVDGFALCVGSIISFCSTMKAQTDSTSSRRGLDSSYKHAKAIAGLLYRCEGIKETIQSICTSQNLSFPQQRDMESSASIRKHTIKKKRKRANRELSPPRKIRPRGSSEKALASPSVLEMLPAGNHHQRNGMRDENVRLESDSDELDSKDEDDDNLSDDPMRGSDDEDDSFGVIGDWAN